MFADKIKEKLPSIRLLEKLCIKFSNLGFVIVKKKDLRSKLGFYTRVVVRTRDNVSSTECTPYVS